MVIDAPERSQVEQENRMKRRSRERANCEEKHLFPLPIKNSEFGPTEGPVLT